MPKIEKRIKIEYSSWKILLTFKYFEDVNKINNPDTIIKIFINEAK